MDGLKDGWMDGVRNGFGICGCLYGDSSSSRLQHRIVPSPHHSIATNLEFLRKNSLQQALN
jgi:hypothetical protein